MSRATKSRAVRPSRTADQDEKLVQMVRTIYQRNARGPGLKEITWMAREIVRSRAVREVATIQVPVPERHVEIYRFFALLAQVTAKGGTA